MDHKDLPILVLPPRGPAVRPWLTTVIDDGTRALVGWTIALTPHTGTVLTAVRMGLVYDVARGPFGAVPAGVRIDQGLEFAATAVRDVFAALCVDPDRLPGYHPHLKGKAERIHRTIDQTLLCALAGFTGGPKPDGKLRTHNLLFRWTDDHFIKARSYSETVWKPALVTAGVIPVPSKDPRARQRFETTRKEGLHQLRHYYASVSLVGGVSIKELAEYLGHADPGFTLRTYAHMMPGSHDRARRAVDDRLFRPRAASDGTATDQGAGA